MRIGSLAGYRSCELSSAGSLQESARVDENYHELQVCKEEELARIAEEAERQLKNRVKMLVSMVFLHPRAGADDELVYQNRETASRQPRWTAEDTAKVRQGLTAYHVIRPYSLAPKTLPNDDRDGNL